jgi:hypothetical protein
MCNLDVVLCASHWVHDEVKSRLDSGNDASYHSVLSFLSYRPT